MKTKEEVLSWWKDNSELAVTQLFGDRFGVRFARFLTLEEMNPLNIEPEKPEEHVPLEWTRENVLKQLKDDVEFGFEKALNKRGISASLMFDVVRKWNKVLEEGLENWDEDDYAMYGLPLFKATAVKYGFENPIGDDTGREDYYNCE